MQCASLEDGLGLLSLKGASRLLCTDFMVVSGMLLPLFRITVGGTVDQRILIMVVCTDVNCADVSYLVIVSVGVSERIQRPLCFECTTPIKIID